MVSEMLSIFICPRKPLRSSTAAYWRVGNASLIINAVPERAIRPDSPAHRRPRKHRAAASDAPKERERFGKQTPTGPEAAECLPLLIKMLEQQSLVSLMFPLSRAIQVLLPNIIIIIIIIIFISDGQPIGRISLVTLHFHCL